MNSGHQLLGAIAGDIIGSVHEHGGTKQKDFPLFDDWCQFTDDTVLTVAVAAALLKKSDYVDVFHEYFDAYPQAGYGSSFIAWARSRQRQPYNSLGNGSAMRVSPVGYAYNLLDEVLAEAERSAAVTHDHPEGIRGAQATAAAIFWARHGCGQAEIRRLVRERFGYPLDQRIDDIRPHYEFDVTCAGSVPQAILAFLESSDYEDAIRTAISLGGDADTQACIAGSIAAAYYGGVPDAIADQAFERLDPRLRKIVVEFSHRFSG